MIASALQDISVNKKNIHSIRVSSGFLKHLPDLMHRFSADNNNINNDSNNSNITDLEIVPGFVPVNVNDNYKIGNSNNNNNYSMNHITLAGGTFVDVRTNVLPGSRTIALCELLSLLGSMSFVHLKRITFNGIRRILRTSNSLHDNDDHYNNTIEELTILHDGDDKMLEILAETLLHYNSNLSLKSIHVSQCHEIGLESFARFLQKCHNNNDDDNNNSMNTSTVQLEKITYSGCLSDNNSNDSNYDIQNDTNSEDINMKESSIYNDKSDVSLFIKSLIPFQCSLTFLDLSGSFSRPHDWISSAFLMELARFDIVSNLSSLSLARCPKFDPSSLSVLLQAIHNNNTNSKRDGGLLHLDISNCTQLAEDELIECLSKVQHLETLKISYCSQLTDTFIQALDNTSKDKSSDYSSVIDMSIDDKNYHNNNELASSLLPNLHMIEMYGLLCNFSDNSLLRFISNRQNNVQITGRILNDDEYDNNDNDKDNDNDVERNEKKNSINDHDFIDCVNNNDNNGNNGEEDSMQYFFES